MIYKIFITFFLFHCSLSKPYKINRELDDLNNQLSKFEKENIEHKAILEKLKEFKKPSRSYNMKLEVPLDLIKNYQYIQSYLDIFENNEFIKKREHIVEKIYKLEDKKLREEEININFI